MRSFPNPLSAFLKRRGRGEIQKGPPNVRQFFLDLPEEGMERVVMTSEVIILRDRYIEAGILPPTRLDDAAHVALATAAEADLMVSWNFRHLVHFEKIRQYNAVNLTLGYKTIEIRSPREVIHEDEGV